jgi:hypothetical protein
MPPGGRPGWMIPVADRPRARVRPEPVDPASAVGSPPAREDVETIHDQVAGFVDAGETDVEGGSAPPAEN